MKQTYWNSNGKYQAAVNALQALVPEEGSVKNPKKNKALEKFRIASNCYYDLYNNGLINRAGAFRRVFNIASRHYAEPWRGYCKFNEQLYQRTEEAMDKIVAVAAIEQGLALLTVETV